MIQYPLVVVLLLLSALASSHIRCGAAAAAAMDASYVAVVSTVLRGASTVIDVAIDGGGHLLYITSTGGIVYRLLSQSSSGASQIVASGFYYPTSITCDTVNNMTYVADTGNYRIRRIDLSNSNAVTTFAGGTLGYQDGTGTAARFLNLAGSVYHHSNGGVVYATDGNYIRKIIVANASVSTITTQAKVCAYLCVSNDGSLLYVTVGNAIVQVNTNGSGVSSVVAGGIAAGGADGVGGTFNTPEGIAFNGDESALFIADMKNYRIRKLVISTRNVTTVAGTGLGGSKDGPALAAATLSSFLFGAKWHCNDTSSSSTSCGLLVADYGNGAVRFVSLERYDVKLSLSSSQRHSTSSISSSSNSSASEQFTRTASQSASSSPSRYPPSSMSLSHSLPTTGTHLFTQSTTNSVSSPSMIGRSISISDSQHCALLPTAGGGNSALLAIGRLHDVTTNAVMQAIPLSPSALPDDDGVSDAGSGGALKSFVRAASLSRQQLLLGQPLIVNLSVSLGGTLRGGNVSNDAWTLVAVELSVSSSYGASPLFTPAVVLFDVVSIDLIGREQFSTYVLHALRRGSQHRSARFSLSRLPFSSCCVARRIPR